MGRGEIVGTAIAIFFMSFAYRMLMGQILEENVGEAKLRDINYLLPWRVWITGRYMKPYVKEYRFFLLYLSGDLLYNICYRELCSHLCFSSVSSGFCLLGRNLASFPRAFNIGGLRSM